MSVEDAKVGVVNLLQKRRFARTLLSVGHEVRGQAWQERSEQRCLYFHRVGGYYLVDRVLQSRRITLQAPLAVLIPMGGIIVALQRQFDVRPAALALDLLRAEDEDTVVVAKLLLAGFLASNAAAARATYITSIISVYNITGGTYGAMSAAIVVSGCSLRALTRDDEKLVCFKQKAIIYFTLTLLEMPFHFSVYICARRQ